jgi:2-polyprenyl-6-methoxyphenol 4-hydroxylase
MPAPGQQHYEVLIIGAGMVGSSLACALARGGLPSTARVLLVEAAPIRQLAPAQQPGYDARSTVRSAGTVACFAQLGLWESCRSAAEAILDIHVSDQGRFGTVQLHAAEEAVPALGYVMENAALGRALNAGLLAAAGIELCAPAEVRSLQPCAQGMRLELLAEGQQQVVTAALVVLADGGRSGLPAALGIHTQTQPYEQTALVANVSFTQPHRGVAYERFTPKGPLALLPLSDFEGQHRAALVWTQPAAAAAEVLALPDAQFLQRLQADFGDRVGAFTRVGRRASFPLQLQLAQEQIRPGLVLLGNVAHTLHPVAGQGFNLALRDSMLLADTILQALQRGADPGAFSCLQLYLQRARRDQQLTIAFSDYMTRLFSSSSSPLVWARRCGMASIDLLPPLKHALSRQAMGLAQPGVRLA